MTPDPNRCSLWILLTTLALTAAAGCAPVREGVDGEGGGGNTLQTALIATDPWTGTQYSLAYVYLVDADYTCQQIFNNYGLAWWDLSSDVEWAQANVYKGQFVDWESEFRSNYSWNQTGGDYSVADFFSGTFGVGGYGGDGDDDDVLPPSPGDSPDANEEREQEGSFGNDLLSTDDTLSIRSWGAERVSGDIRAANGDWSFDAIYCGDLPGEVIGFGSDGSDDGGESFPDAP